jgi:hypothetical protein
MELISSYEERDTDGSWHARRDCYAGRQRYEGAAVVPCMSESFPALGISREVVPFEGGRYMGRERRWAGVDAAALSVFETEADAIAWVEGA